MGKLKALKKKNPKMLTENGNGCPKLRSYGWSRAQGWGDSPGMAGETNKDMKKLGNHSNRHEIGCFGFICSVFCLFVCLFVVLFLFLFLFFSKHGFSV